jgi:hypothetical protein
MLFMTQSNLLDFFIWTLKIAYAFIIYPDTHTRFYSLLDTNNPILIAIHCNYIIGMSLHEDLFSSLNVLLDEDTTSTVVDGVLFEDEVGVVEGRE